MFNRIRSVKWRFLPIFLLFAVYPLIVRLVHFKLDPSYQALYLSETSKDWFFYYKSVAFILLTVWMLLCIVALRKKIKLHRDVWFQCYYLLGGVFIITSLLSAFFSDYRTCSIFGAPTRFEGIGVIVCYIMVMFYTFFVFEEKKTFKYMLIGLMILVLIQLILGISQFIGYDLMNMMWIRDFISPGEVEQYYYFSPGTEPLFLPTQPGAWTGSIGNKNYSGSFIALALPLLATLTWFCKKKWLQVALFFTTLASIFIMFACQSQAGQVGIACVFIAFIILFFKAFPTAVHTFKTSDMRKKTKYLSLTLFMIVYLTFTLYATGASREIHNMFYSIGVSLGMVEEKVNTALKSPQVVDFDFDTHKVSILTEDGDTLHITVTPDALKFEDQDGTLLTATEFESGSFVLKSPAFYNYTFSISRAEAESCLFFLLMSESGDLSAQCGFLMDQAGKVSLVSYSTLQPIEIDTPPTLGFEGHERLGSGRGYIWSRSLPLLKDYMLLGEGPDTFIYAFPQNDFWGKWQHMGNPFIVVDKPHNTYLQIWINQGFIALLAFVLINAIYLFHCIKLYAFKKSYSFDEAIGIGIMLGVIGYLVASFFNDTTLSVTPLYFALLGSGMAYNRIYTLASSEETAEVVQD
ncbi:MAG: O-antigen ligase family protein [Cellulosilyticaceae bacterium]